MKRNPDRMTASVAVAFLSSVLALDSEVSQAQETTYGQDAVPNSQFWLGPFSLGYGIDPVPFSSMSDAAAGVMYGMDGVPRSRYYSREFDGDPVLDRTEQVLTGGVEEVRKAPVPKRYTPRRNRWRGR